MKVANKLLLASAVSSLLVSNIFAAESLAKQGEKIFNDKNKGNCLACHNISGQKIDGPGSLGPDLSNVGAYPEEVLHEVIYDPYASRSHITAMPAFGKNGWLTDDEIKAVIAYLKTIN
jgi:sulfur-oxidizing protein SoxX